MAFADDFSVSIGGDIRHTSGTTTYEVIELHRFLGALAWNASASGDDLANISSKTPSDRSTDQIITLRNGYNIDDEAAKFLFGGSITQDNGNTVYSGLKVLGAVNNPLTQLKVIQDNNEYQFTDTPSAPFWGNQSSGGLNGNAAAGELMRCLIKSRINGADIDGKRIRVQARHWGDTYDFFPVTLGLAEQVAAISTTPDAQNTTTQGTVTAYTHVVNSGGTANAPVGGFQTIDLNNGNGPQEYCDKWTYGADTSGDGLKGIWEYIKDLSGTGSAKTIDGLNGELFIGLTHSYAYDAETNGPFVEQEEIVWGTEIRYDSLVSGPFTEGNYVTIGSAGAAGRVLYDDGVNKLIVALEKTSITLLDNDVITEYSGPGKAATTTTAAIDTGTGAILNNNKSGGTALLRGLDDDGTTGNHYIQLLTGSAPVDNLPILGTTSGAEALVNGASVAKTVPKIFVGSYTGTLIGAYGVGFASGDLSASDTIEDLAGVVQTPPNNVTFSVTGLVSGEDQVLVGPRLAGELEIDQDTINGTLTHGVSTSIVMTTPIPSYFPSSGSIRVKCDNGAYEKQSYVSRAGSTYVLTGTYTGSNGEDATTGNEAYISYIDKLADAAQVSFTTVYSTDVPLYVRVRDGGATPTKTFEVPATLTSSGGSVAAVRTSDA